MERPHEKRLRELREYWMERQADLQWKKAIWQARVASGYGIWVHEAVKPERSAAEVARREVGGLRERAGLTPTQLAERLGVQRSTIQRMENGARRDMTLNAMERFANACGFEVRVCFLESEKPKVRYVKMEE